MNMHGIDLRSTRHSVGNLFFVSKAREMAYPSRRGEDGRVGLAIA
jgi:hypothetical protein